MTVMSREARGLLHRHNVNDWHDVIKGPYPKTTHNTVCGNLHIGGGHTGPPDRRFRTVVTVAHPWEVPHVPGGVVHLSHPFDDAITLNMKELTRQVTRAVEATLRGVDRGLVLVRCYAGLNRSGLVCALVLREAMNATPDEAVTAVRAARGWDAIANPVFRDMIDNW